MEYTIGAFGMLIILYLIGKYAPDIKTFDTVTEVVKDVIEPKEGKWSNMVVCSNCKSMLTHSQKMHASGRCCHCGHKGHGSGTIVDYDDVAIRYSRATSEWLTALEYEALIKKS